VPPCAHEIDAAGHFVTSGCADANCHLDQPEPPPVKMADDFNTDSPGAAIPVGSSLADAPLFFKSACHERRSFSGRAADPLNPTLRAAGKFLFNATQVDREERRPPESRRGS
jgi:hypothetical protein